MTLNFGTLPPPELRGDYPTRREPDIEARLYAINRKAQMEWQERGAA